MMKPFWAIALLTLLPTSVYGQRRAHTPPAAPSWQDNQFCPDTTQCDRAWLWTEPGAGSILVKLNGETLSLSIRSQEWEEEICLSPAEVRIIFRQKVLRTCTECMALTDGSKAKLLNWVDLGTVPSQPLHALPWAVTALAKLQTENDQLAPLVKKALGGTNAP